MMKKINLKKTALIIAIILLAIQSLRIDKTNTPIDTTKDFISLNIPSSQVANTLKIACYDCHSNQATYPWYTNIAPVSWWIKHHINEGREHLNFSEWGTYSVKRKNHKLEECVEMVEENEMPMASYTWMHKDAKLSDAQKLELVTFFKSLMGSQTEEHN